MPPIRPSRAPRIAWRGVGSWGSPRDPPGRLLNRDSYDAIADSWDAARRALHGREQVFLETFLEGLSLPSEILDLGCGTGRPIAETVLARGHLVTGVDQSTRLLGKARARFPLATWIESRIEDFESPQRFSGVLCWDALFHLERAKHQGLLSRMASFLEPGGRLAITVGGSEHPPFTDTMFGETFFYDSFPPEEVLKVLLRCGFEVQLGEFLNEPTSGRDKGRYAILARKS